VSKLFGYVHPGWFDIIEFKTKTLLGYFNTLTWTSSGIDLQLLNNIIDEIKSTLKK